MRIIGMMYEIGFIVAVILKIMNIVDISWMAIILFFLLILERTSDIRLEAKSKKIVYDSFSDAIGQLEYEIENLKSENRELRYKIEKMYE